MKHSFNIIKLMVAITLIASLMASCSTSNSVRYAKKHGLVTRGCRGYYAHEKLSMSR